MKAKKKPQATPVQAPANPAPPTWADQWRSDLTALRQEIVQRGLDPDAPQHWVWDPWPDRSSDPLRADEVSGRGTPCRCLDPAAGAERPLPRRLLEAHVHWHVNGIQHRLLVLPNTETGGLRCQWHTIDQHGRTFA